MSVVDRDGHPYGCGCGGPACYPDRRLNAAVSSDADATTARWIGRVTPDVAAVVVTMSDGTREDLTLHGDTDRSGARVAVLVHPHSLDIQRVDVLDENGVVLTETRTETRTES